MLLDSKSLAPRVSQAVWQYGLAALSVVAALSITISLERYTTLRTPLFYIAIIISAWFGRLGAGLLAVLSSTFLVGHYFAPGDAALSAESGSFILLFFLSSLLACWITVQRRRAEDALEQARAELETRVEERTAELRRVSEGLQAEIVERQRAEMALKKAFDEIKKSEDQLQTIIDTIPTLAWRTEADGSTEFLNRRWLDYTGLSAEQAKGWGWTAAIHPDDREKLMATWRKVLASGTSSESEARIRRFEGEYRWFLFRTVPLRDKLGNISKWYGINTDIEDRKRAEDALDHAQAELAHVSRVATLGEMSASIAHEINQPLAAVITNANACLRWLTRQAPDLNEARAAVERIIRDGSRASAVIGRVRALAKKAPPRQDCFDINETIIEALALARSQIQANRVSLQTHLADNVPSILGDRIQLQQVILNLIINAIEAMSGTAVGPRELRISTARDASDGVLAAVRDSGPGLNSASLEHLFDPFYTTKPHGMGMGLAISRSIIQAHGGGLWAASNDGPGAAFYFTLPPASNLRED